MESDTADPREVLSDSELARRRCSEWLGGEVAAHHLIAKQISGGITNVLYRVRLRAEYKSFYAQSSVPQDLVDGAGVGVRFFGPSGHCKIVDREEEAAVTAAAQAICKRTYYRFEGGQVDEWISGRHITHEECLLPAYRDAIASGIAKFHLVPYRPAASVETIDQNPQHVLVKRLDYWIGKLSTDASRYLPEAGKRLAKDLFGDFELFIDAYNTIDNSLVGEEVLCHNDLLTGNIIICEEFNDDFNRSSPRDSECKSSSSGRAPRIEFIDYEYASKGWNVYDLSNHLVETASADWAVSHDAQYIKDFVTTYLDVISAAKDSSAQATITTTSSSHRDADEECVDTISSTSPGSHISSEHTRADDLDEFVRMIEFCAPLTHYYWAVWGLAQSANTTSLKRGGRAPHAADCDFVQFAATRYARWLSTKDVLTRLIEVPLSTHQSELYPDSLSSHLTG